MDRHPVSKSERKRQATHLQKLGQRLAELKPDEVTELQLPARLTDALADFRRFGSFEARRRQLQFIGKLMRDVDIEPIQALLERHDGQSAAARHDFHQLERWRDRLISDPDALTEYLHEHRDADRQKLRHQLRKVSQARDDAQRKNASRELFRLLREFG